MVISPESALKVAEFLLQIKAVVLKPQEPFTWASGLKSPIYCDNRKALSYPKIRTYIRQELTRGIQDKYGKPDLIAGVATGAIAHGVLTAQDMGLPFAYVRSAPKGHGLSNLIEGVTEPNQTVVVVEDLISTGKSSLEAVKALRDAGCKVKGMIAIFSYGLDEAHENFKKNKCPVSVLCNYDFLLRKAVEVKYISDKQLTSLKKWRENPGKWKAE